MRCAETTCGNWQLDWLCMPMISTFIHATARGPLTFRRLASFGCRFWEITLEANGRRIMYWRVRTVRCLAGWAPPRMVSLHVRLTTAFTGFIIIPGTPQWECSGGPVHMPTIHWTEWLRGRLDLVACP